MRINAQSDFQKAEFTDIRFPFDFKEYKVTTTNWGVDILAEKAITSKWGWYLGLGYYKNKFNFKGLMIIHS